jgi:lipopolysaccharide transport system permease protein
MATEQTIDLPRGRVGGSYAERVRARLTYLCDVTLHLARRDLSSRHRGSLFGWLWALMPSLLQLLVSYFLFTKVIPLHVPNYPLFLLTGILAWNWFARSVTLAATSLEHSRELVLRPGFMTAVLPAKDVLVALLDYLLALPVLLVALLATTGLHPAIALLPVLLTIQLLLVAGVAWVVAPLQVFFRDVQHIVIVLVTVGFWITPVFYARKSVPSRFELVYKLNPMAHLIEWQRGIILGGRLPNLASLLALLVIAFLLACVGLAVFLSLRDRVPEHL